MKEVHFFEKLVNEKLVATQHNNSEDQKLQLQAVETLYMALVSLFRKLNSGFCRPIVRSKAKCKQKSYSLRCDAGRLHLSES